MADLHPSLQQGDKNFDDYIDRLHNQHRFPPEAIDAWRNANDTLSIARALAKAQFGDAATPDHALAIFQVVTADMARRADILRTDTE